MRIEIETYIFVLSISLFLELLESFYFLDHIMARFFDSEICL